ncbi:MAG: hypothetical protein ACXADA_15075 [Candidatus Hodarchaeales archaeon]|jgi:hypothetical protein
MTKEISQVKKRYGKTAREPFIAQKANRLFGRELTFRSKYELTFCDNGKNMAPEILSYFEINSKSGKNLARFDQEKMALVDYVIGIFANKRENFCY